MLDKLTLVVVDEDQVFLDFLLTYIRDSKYEQSLIVKVFTHNDVFQMYLQTSEKPHILLVNPNMFSGKDLAYSTTCVVVWLDETGGDKLAMSPTVIKHQPLNRLLDHLLSLYDEHRAMGYKPGGGRLNTQIISVYSTVGGCGKTTLAANLAKLLAFLDHKVFYLNLESIGSVPMFPSSVESSQSFSQLLYYAIANPDQLPKHFEELKRCDPVTRVDFVYPPNKVRGMEEVTAEGIEKLLQWLTTYGQYDYIVVDLESSLQERITKTIAMSDEIMWIILDDVHCLHKTILLREELNGRLVDRKADDLRSDDLRSDDRKADDRKADDRKADDRLDGWQSKIHFLLNKYTGTTGNDFGLHDIPISGYLPYMPRWKSTLSIGELMNENIFHGHLIQWFLSRRGERAIEPSY